MTEAGHVNDQLDRLVITCPRGNPRHGVIARFSFHLQDLIADKIDVNRTGLAGFWQCCVKRR